MKRSWIRLFKVSVIFIAGLLGYQLFGNVELEVTFPRNEVCVAYKTNKSMIFQDSVDVVGLNCKIKLKKEEKNGKVRVYVQIPLDSFDSGEKGRDQFVFDYLKGKENPSLKFTSREYSAAAFAGILRAQNSSLSGSLTIGSESSPVEFRLEKKGGIIVGKMVTSFTHFQLEPPVVGPFGMVAALKDEIELYLQAPLKALK